MFSAITFSRYKSFSLADAVELTDLKHVNVVIGKNNSGKSSVLDMINAACDADYYAKNKPEITSLGARYIVGPENLADFSRYSSIGNRSNPGKFAEQNMSGKLFQVEILVKKNPFLDRYDFTYINSENQIDSAFSKNVFGTYSDVVSNLFKDVAASIQRANEFTFRRLSAERNISPEMESQDESLDCDGVGASNLVRKYINNSQYDETLIESSLLDSLNSIMSPEAVFENIRVQEIQKGKDLLWEIFLQEKGCGRFALSQSGSGLKTIILLLLNLLVIPKTTEYNGKNIVFGFEELENNLHPAMQRKVFEFIYEYAIRKDTYVFLTTHSHVAINTFFGKDDAQIFHVQKENNVSTIKKIDNFMDECTVLDDLEIRASDLLQSNGIIWVEGPSDRTYIKRWLDVFFGNQFLEGKHYQFLYYGGKLLSHYTANEADDLINILTTNRNAVIVIDSDKKSKQAVINLTKKRIVAEFEKYGMLAWVTKGKEIENYIPASAIADLIGNPTIKQCSQYQLFPEYIRQYYKNFVSNKVTFSNEVKSFITKENSSNILDLESQIKHLYQKIKSWN
jgi:putative ATP-dependent endonuclease of OLD family